MIMINKLKELYYKHRAKDLIKHEVTLYDYKITYDDNSTKDVTIDYYSTKDRYTLLELAYDSVSNKTTTIVDGCKIKTLYKKVKEVEIIEVDKTFVYELGGEGNPFYFNQMWTKEEIENENKRLEKYIKYYNEVN